jgi:hypothetical protein
MSAPDNFRATEPGRRPDDDEGSLQSNGVEEPESLIKGGDQMVATVFTMGFEGTRAHFASRESSTAENERLQAYVKGAAGTIGGEKPQNAKKYKGPQNIAAL